MERTPTSRIVSRLFEVLQDRDTEFAELQAGVVEVVWGFLIASTGYASLGPIGRPASVVIGCILLAIGAIQLASLLANSWGWRRFASGAAVVAWVFFLIVLIMKNVSGLVPSTTVLFSFSSMWGFVRMVRGNPRGGVQIGR